jgi:protein O-GlcNAc transferase
MKAHTSWFRRHPRRTAVLAGMVLLVIVASVYLAWPNNQQPLSSNPVVAGYQKQLPALAKKAKDNPQSSQAMQDYAMALYATGDTANAKVQYEKAIALDPKDATLRNNVGNVYRDLGDYTRAIEAYRLAITLPPDDVHPYTNLANIYLYKLNNRDEAIAIYKEAIAKLPKNQELPVLLGIAYEQIGDRVNAAAAFQSALDGNPNNAAAAAGLKRVQ